LIGRGLIVVALLLFIAAALALSRARKRHLRVHEVTSHEIVGDGAWSVTQAKYPRANVRDDAKAKSA
jgi:protein-S-isoprenylcysteine O-methyltransferase Ste14